MNRKRVMCRWGSLAAGCGGLALAFWGLTHASRLPGAVGETLRHNLASGREVTAIFYTELGDWLALAADAGQTREAGGRPSSGAAENIAPGTPARSGCALEGNSRRRVSRRCD